MPVFEVPSVSVRRFDDPVVLPKVRVVVSEPIERARFEVGACSWSQRPVPRVQEPQAGADEPPLDCKHCPVVPAEVEPIAEVPLPKRIPFGVSVFTPVPPLLTVRAFVRASELP